MKHRPVKQSSFFKTKDEKLERIRKICDRCGDGTFMADHGNRWYCGKCKLTIWKQKNK